MAGFSYLLNPKAVEEGCLAIVLPNIIIGEFKCTVFPIQMYKKV